MKEDARKIRLLPRRLDLSMFNSVTIDGDEIARSKNIEFIVLCTERINDMTIQGKFTDEQLEHIASILSQITI